MPIPGIMASRPSAAPTTGDFTMDEIFTTASFDSGSLSNTAPYNTFYESSCWQCVLTKSQLEGVSVPTGAKITHVSMWATQAGGTTVDSLTFDFKDVNFSTMSSIQTISGFTQGLRITSGSQLDFTSLTTGDWTRYTMTSDVYWDGGASNPNLLISIYVDLDPYASGGQQRYLTGGTTTSGAFWGYRKDNETYPTVNTSYDYNHGAAMPQLKIEWED